MNHVCKPFFCAKMALYLVIIESLEMGSRLCNHVPDHTHDSVRLFMSLGRGLGSKDRLTAQILGKD